MANERILIVQSDLILAWDIAESLELQGYEVCTVRTGAEGARRAAWFDPHLAIVDADVPDGSDPSQVMAKGPVLFVTSASQWNPAHSGPSSAVGVIRKPFLEAELLAKVADAMAAGRMNSRLSEVRRLEVETLV